MKDKKIIKNDNVWKKSNQYLDSFNYYSKNYSNIKDKFILKYPILEIGGGPGTFLNYLNIKNADIMDLSGKEFLVNKNYVFKKTDITKKLPNNKRYKTIFLMETLEHIKNPLYLMAQIYDILDNKGNCFISIPYTSINYERKVKKNESPYGVHVCRWKDYEIKNQLEKIGFNVEFLEKRRRFKNLAFFLPHCWLVLKLTKRMNN